MYPQHDNNNIIIYKCIASTHILSLQYSAQPALKSPRNRLGIDRPADAKRNYSGNSWVGIPYTYLIIVLYYDLILLYIIHMF